MAIRECRNSGLSVRAWCQQQGITPTTYYRWEQEVLSLAGDAAELSGREFVELPAVEQEKRKVAERTATLRIGNDSIQEKSDLKSKFTGTWNISRYAQDATRWAVEQGIITGYPNGTFNPKGQATRAEVAIIITRFLAKLKD